MLSIPVVALAEPPAAGTPEATVRASLILLRDGKSDEWISSWCDTSTLCSPAGIPDLKRFALTRAQSGVKHCLHAPDDSIKVTRVEGDPAKDTEVKIWIKCEESRMPTPSTQKKVGDKWLVTSFSW